MNTQNGHTIYPPETVHILGFAGSLRKRSHNRALLRAAQEMLPSGVTMEIFDLDDLPFFNSDVEAAGTPDAVLAFRAAMQRADALLIASPEYNYSVTGVLKNALDWASRKGPDERPPLDGKVVGIMGAGGGFGTIRSQLHLREILQHNDTFVLPRPQVTLARAGAHFDENGRLVDERSRAKVQALLDAVHQWVLKLRHAEQFVQQPVWN